jgi:predicted Zn-dependent protease
MNINEYCYTIYRKPAYTIYLEVTIKRDIMKLLRKFILLCSACIVIVSIISPERALGITVQEERELSREVMKVILKHYELINDPLIVNYVNDVGNKIISVLPPQPFTYRFYVVKDDVYNAFATPAGHIFINSGLLEAMENEEELAGIIAHEIAHVVCRHISQKIERSEKIKFATMAGIVAGIFLGAGGAATAANAVTFGSIAAGQSIALVYSREDETQADQIGLDSLARAGYSSKGLVSVLTKIRSKQWFGPDQIPTYLKTHPALAERMALIDTRLEKKAVKVDSYNFERAHTRLVAVYGDTGASLTKFESDVRNHPANPLAHYGYGLVLAKTGNRKDAAAQLKTALKKRAFDPYILKDLGLIYFLDGRYQEALLILEGATSITSDDPESFFYLGRTQMELGLIKDAAVTFENLIAKHFYYTQALYSLGETYTKLGRQGDAHYYLGIYYKRKANLKSAAFHLARALENLADPDKKAKIKEMLKEIRKEESLMRVQESTNERKR